jgi:hypothetical protein
MTRLHSGVVAGSLLALAGFPLAGCTTDVDPEPSPTHAIVFENELSDSIRAICDLPEAPLLSDLTSWEWDRVSVFSGATTSESLEDAVGQPVLDQGFFHSDTKLLVFQKDGEIVTLRSSAADFAFVRSPGVTSYSSAARLEPNSEGGTCPRILTDPA